MTPVARGQARVLLVGLGGLGCPAALVLARAGVAVLGLCDDDVVERSNLHRQILFAEADVGRSKVDAAARAIGRLAGSGHAPELRLHRTRLLPDNALAIASEYDIVLEGADNFATKFLASDACALARVAAVHASAVRWVGTALAVGPGGRPCYRCLFEDVLPADDAPSCAEAGVMGPVVGVVAAAQVDLALSLLDGSPVEGELVTFDGRTDVLRRRTISRRADCPLCGELEESSGSPGPGRALVRIERIDPERYVSPACAG
jgi:molybdopterin/thiamine biosynthesis adenylyltransferase